MGEPAEFERLDVRREKPPTPRTAAPLPSRRPTTQLAREATDIPARIQAVVEAGRRLRLLLVADHPGIRAGMTGLFEGIDKSEFVVESVAGGHVLAMTGETDALAAEIFDSRYAVINPTPEHRAWLIEDARLRTRERRRSRRNP